MQLINVFQIGRTSLMLAKVKEVAQVLLDAGAIKDVQDMVR